MPLGSGRGWPFALAALVLIAGRAPPAAAEPPLDEDARKTEGRAHFQRGLELSDDQAWDAAYAEYVTSLASYPTKAATKNAALCLRMMHRYAEALEMLERFRGFSNLTTDDRAFADRETKEMSRYVGSLVVR